MYLRTLEQFRDNTRLEFEWRERLCDQLEEHYGFEPSEMVEDDRMAFRRVFDMICKERNELHATLQSARALRAAYIDYMEHVAADAIYEMNHDDFVDIDKQEAWIRRYHSKIDLQRNVLRKLPESHAKQPAPRTNPFYLTEEIPPRERMPKEATALNASDAVRRYAWLALKTCAEFLAFADTDAGEFLKDHNAWDTDEVRKAKAEERMLFFQRGWKVPRTRIRHRRKSWRRGNAGS